MSSNKYKQPPSIAPFALGQQLDPSGWNFRNAHVNKVRVPCKALNVVQSTAYVSGWGITVDTEQGFRTIDSGFFKPYQP